MKGYLASRTCHSEFIKYLGETLKKHNHEITFDWTLLENLKPFKKIIKNVKIIYKKISKAISKSNIFALITDNGGTDMFVELGITINNYEQQGSPKIYVVGKYNQRSLMHFHCSINPVKSIKDILVDECPEILINEKINFPEF